MTVPIISLEVQGVKYRMQQALSEYSLQIDKNVQEAIESYCSDDNLKQVINKSVKDALDAAVKEEVRQFFSYTNNGRRAIREAVIDHLNTYFEIEEE